MTVSGPQSRRVLNCVRATAARSIYRGFQTARPGAKLLAVTMRKPRRRCVLAIVGVVAGCLSAAHGTPANKAAVEKHYDRFLAKGLARCTLCHLPSENKNPESLDDFP